MTAARWLHATLSATLCLACQGRELTVFELPPATGGSGAAGAAGSLAAMTGGVGGSGGSDPGGSSGSSGAPGAPAAGSSGDLGGAGGSGGSGGAGGLPSGGAGAGGSAGMPAGMPCSVDDDCAGWRCEKPGCGAETGTCEPPVVFVPPDLMPVCGCDGVTYWNDFLRRQLGAVLASVGECRSTACACEVGADCETPFASCSHLNSGDMCGHGTGACWVLPSQCPADADAKLWRECKPPDAGEPPHPCVDTCTAIAAEKPYGQPRHGATCP